MPEQLPKQAGKRSRYYPDEVPYRRAVERCINFRIIHDRIDALKVEKKDKHLTEADFSLIALRQCVRCRTHDPNDSCALEHFIPNA